MAVGETVAGVVAEGDVDQNKFCVDRVVSISYICRQEAVGFAEENRSTAAINFKDPYLRRFSHFPFLAPLRFPPYHDALHQRPHHLLPQDYW